MPRTNCIVEGFHNAIQSLVTNMHPSIWKLTRFLTKKEILENKGAMQNEDINQQTKENKREIEIQMVEE